MKRGLTSVNGGWPSCTIALVQEATLEVPISRARQNLFAYFDQAVRQEGAKIFIARRGQKQRAVLVSAGYLAALENRSTLKPADGNRGPKFHMAGSARIIGDPETVISDVRAWQKKLQRQKEQRWAKEFRKHGQRGRR